MYQKVYLDFLQEAYKEQVKVNIYEFAAQKILKYEKLKKEKKDKLRKLEQFNEPKPVWKYS